MDTPTPLSGQQPPPQEAAATNPDAVSSGGAWQNSGSVGPFFAVISVLTLLAILSCVFGRKCAGRDTLPLKSFGHGGWFAWVKDRRWGRGNGGGEVGVKLAVASEQMNDGKENPPQA